MKLYDRDYTSITELEQEQEISITNEHTTYLKGGMKIYNSGMFRKFPKAIRHFRSIFPNNYLDVVDLDNDEDLKAKNERYKALIDNPKTIETDILNHLKITQSFHILGSILKEYHFGHHGAYLFPEFKLGNTYEVDYLLLGDSSGGYQFLLVELENPYGRITIGDGEFGDVIRKGIKQIVDWKIWMEANYSSFIESFEKETTQQLPKEFYKLDSSRINYCVVAGRRNNFTEKTYSLKRRLEKEQGINLLHYDNLFDLAERIIGEATY